MSGERNQTPREPKLTVEAVEFVLDFSNESFVGELFGAQDGDRNHDLFLTKEVLYPVMMH